MRLLIIEDEPQLCETISEGFRLSGYEVDMCGDGDEALLLCTTEPYDLILLDLNLPGLDGMEVLQKFRETNTNTPVLILSARCQTFDKVNGLDLGANDYLTKPFHFEELEARVRSLTRRKFVQQDVLIACGDIIFNTKSRTATANGIPLALTRKECGVLEYLMIHESEVVSSEELMEHVWDSNMDSFSNSIRVHISSLRKKLRVALGYDPIQNKVGQGYRIGDEKA